MLRHEYGLDSCPEASKFSNFCHKIFLLEEPWILFKWPGLCLSSAKHSYLHTCICEHLTAPRPTTGLGASRTAKLQAARAFQKGSIVGTLAPYQPSDKQTYLNQGAG